MTLAPTMRCDRTNLVLDWLTAVLVACLWVVGQTADYLPENSLIHNIVWSSHVSGLPWLPRVRHVFCGSTFEFSRGLRRNAPLAPIVRDAEIQESCAPPVVLPRSWLP